MKKYIVVLSLFLFTLCVSYGTVSARGWCFASWTLISTPKGDISIEKLHIGDEILGYDFISQKKIPSTIWQIDIYQRAEYYRINNKTLVTAEHPFYVSVWWKIILREVSALKEWDKLINESWNEVIITSIEKIISPIQVYNLVNIEPTHNYFANRILVHNKWGGGGWGGGWGGWSHSSSRPLTPQEIAASEAKYDRIFSQIQAEIARAQWSYNPLLWGSVIMWILIIGFQDPVFGLIDIFLLFFVGIFFFQFLRYIWKRFILLKIPFTTDVEILTFVQKIVSEFSGKYSISYKSDTETWRQKKPKKALDPMEYMPFSSENPIDILQKYFIQYEYNWTTKNWENMQSYLTEEYLEEQKYLFESDFWQNYDINYDPQIDSLTAISIEPVRERDDSRYSISVRCQVNANMINFEINPSWGVMSGKATRRSFTDYWTLTYDTISKIWMIDDIHQG